MLGTTCAEVLNSKKYGVMLAIQNEAIGCVPLEEVVRKKKFVPISPVDHSGPAGGNAIRRLTQRKDR